MLLLHSIARDQCVHSPMTVSALVSAKPEISKINSNAMYDTSSKGEMIPANHC